MSGGALIACRAVDHLAFTVPDLDEAVDFFVRLFGAVELYRRDYGPLPGEMTMAEQFNTHPQAHAMLAKLDLAGTAIELFRYEAPDLRTDMPRNCDAGGSHFGIAVDSLDMAIERLRAEPGVRILGTPSVLPPGHPLAGRRWIYLLTPWGLQIELVSDSGRPCRGEA